MPRDAGGVQLLEVGELAEQIGCCRETVLRIFRRHEVPVLRTRAGYLVSSRAWRNVVEGREPHLDTGTDE